VCVRLRAVIVVTLLLGAIGALPNLISPAGASPRAVIVATHDMAPFVDTDKDIKSGFTIDILDQIAKRQGWDLT